MILPLRRRRRSHKGEEKSCEVGVAGGVKLYQCDDMNSV